MSYSVLGQPYTKTLFMIHLIFIINWETNISLC